MGLRGRNVAGADRSGAWSKPAAFRIVHPVDTVTEWPSRPSRPCRGMLTQLLAEITQCSILVTTGTDRDGCVTSDSECVSRTAGCTTHATWLSVRRHDLIDLEWRRPRPGAEPAPSLERPSGSTSLHSGRTAVRRRCLPHRASRGGRDPKIRLWLRAPRLTWDNGCAADHIAVADTPPLFPTRAFASGRLRRSAHRTARGPMLEKE